MTPHETLSDYMQTLKAILPKWAEYVEAVIDIEDTYDCEEMEYFLYSRKVGIPFGELENFWQTMLYLTHLAAHLWMQTEDETYPELITKEFYEDGLSIVNAGCGSSRSDSRREREEENAGIPLILPQREHDYA